MRPIAAIQSIVCEVFGLTHAQLTGPNRKRIYARPRQLAMFICRELADVTLPEIGRRFNRDHTTVLHAVRAISTWGEREPEFEWLAAIAIWRCAFAVPVPWQRDPVRIAKQEKELEELARAFWHSETIAKNTPDSPQERGPGEAREIEAQGIIQA